MKTTCYRNLLCQRKAWHEATLRTKQKFLTDLEPKGIRKYNCKHVNIAKNTNQFRLSEKLEHAKQLTSRHVYELDALTTEHGMTN